MYALRGLITYQSGHYFSYQRKIFIKYDFLDVNYQTLREDLAQMEGEVSDETEWQLYNDEEVRSVPDSWFGVIT